MSRGIARVRRKVREVTGYRLPSFNTAVLTMSRLNNCFRNASFFYLRGLAGLGNKYSSRKVCVTPLFAAPLAPYNRRSVLVKPW
ncbi:hypothetical protein ANAPC5_01300 [Anaplasma phagocytophilum]|nr:hypothetical protein ANAPC5_01300 [Anaplasma phagocytophilum]